MASRVVAVVRGRPVVTALLGFATVVWAVLCIVVGMPIPDAVALWLAVALLAAGLLTLRGRLADRNLSAAAAVSQVAGPAPGNGPAAQAGFPAPVRRRSPQVAPVVATFVAAVAVFGVIQLLPYRNDRTPPPSTGEPAWATPQTRELMVRACFGCHSNDVEYPPYAGVAPISWLVQAHIDDGRGKVNYSTFATDPGDAPESVETILDGSMPPKYYTAFGRNPDAVLTPAEVDELVAGLRATPGLGQD